MIYALYRLNRQVKAVQQLLPNTGLLVTHCVLLVLIVVTALGFYVAQYAYFYHECDQSEFTLASFCVLAANWLELFNGAYTFADALCYALILLMTFKFLVPTEKVDVIARKTSWLKQLKSKAP